MTADHEPALKQPRRRPLRDVLLACMVVLLLAQGLIGALSLSALNRLTTDNTAERIELLARRTSSQIQTGMALGKPLAQFFGLSSLLDQLKEQVPDFAAASVLLINGQELASVGEPANSDLLLQALSSGRIGSNDVSRLSSGAVSLSDAQGIRVAVPLMQPDGVLAGAVVLRVEPTDMQQGSLLRDNILVLGLSTLVAALLLALTFRYAMPLHQLAAASKARLLIPLVILMLAQGAYAAYTIHTFRDVWVGVTQDNTLILGSALQHDLNRVLGYGVAPTSLRGVEQPMSRLAASFPFISELRLLDGQGKLLNRANAQGAMVLHDAQALRDPLVFPLRADSQGPVLATLQIGLNEAQISAGVRARVLDAATVVAVAMVVAIELLLLLALLMDRAFSTRMSGKSGEPIGLDDQTNVGALVRPVMFGFLFAMALPLSFLPLYAKSLLTSVEPDQSAALLMALPIAVEMGCGLLTALLAGRLTDRRGWQWPVLAGLLVAVLGNLFCALAGSLAWFTLARGLVGLGYGLTWMGLQGFIVLRSPAAYRGRNMATVIAGLFAGHLSGAAVGAMLVQQVGAAAVFAIGALLLVLPTLGVFTLMWPYRHMAAQKVAAFVVSPVVRSWRAVGALLGTRDFGMLLAGCVIPFSIAQVGLLTYALPLYMEEQGATSASVGRILMLYGFCVIYIGPWMGRMADRSAYKKQWIVLGGIVGSVGLLSMYFANGVLAAAVAVVLLALASCLAGGAQTVYMLSLDSVHHYGAGGATSVMRAADKFGQMLGPLAVGGLFASVGISGGLAVTGAFYLLATLAFLLVAPRQVKA
ncbi:MFS transporter [Pusillimonas sp. ANT_WB101]|uniref:MFS transporter n=1 Tax=Pusillimonas sp. ANT_WB101 TaxID=2597356 RepID=UPI0011ECC2D0|nr:MFS transporter [Pusillimonas sp. ANT_WB101]KAA0892947.1 MFS transporter [Pusillimonas sp. ANT_WB101]